MTFKRIEAVEIASTEVSYDGEILIDGTVQVRKCTINKDAAGSEIGCTYHRHVLHPGDDYSNEPEEVQVECRREHTAEKIQARKDFVAAMEAKFNE
jgi:hypothetical protein